MAFSLFRVCRLNFSKFSFVLPLFTHNAVFVHFDFTPEFTPLYSDIPTKVNQEPWVFFFGPNKSLDQILHHIINWSETNFILSF